MLESFGLGVREKESFEVEFYEKESFENGKYTFSDSKEIKAFSAEEAADEFAKFVWTDHEMYIFGCDEVTWDEDYHSVIVKDKDGNISRFSVRVDMKIVFSCDEIAL